MATGTRDPIIRLDTAEGEIQNRPNPLRPLFRIERERDWPNPIRARVWHLDSLTERPAETVGGHYRHSWGIWDRGGRKQKIWNPGVASEDGNRYRTPRLQWHDTGYSDTVRRWLLTLTLFQIPKDLSYSKHVWIQWQSKKLFPYIDTLLVSQHCHCKLGGLYLGISGKLSEITESLASNKQIKVLLWMSCLISRSWIRGAVSSHH